MVIYVTLFKMTTRKLLQIVGSDWKALENKSQDAYTLALNVGAR